MVYIKTGSVQDRNTAQMIVEGLPHPPSGEEPLPWRNVVEWSSNYELDQSGRPWLQAMLPILMRAKETGVFADSQDAEAFYNASQAKRLMSSWWSWMKDVRLSARTIDPDFPEGRGVGCFFSGGVDSFYSAISRSEEITHLIFVKSGFDIFPPNKTLTERTNEAVESVARSYGLPLITLETNVRELSSRFARWGHRYHGAALATVAHLLSSHIRKAIIPSTYQREELHPWGSHPRLDPLYSSSYVEIVHDSVEPNRSEKVQLVAQDPVAMKHLRVCWKNPNGEYNCGRCEKCVRTMLSLYIFDALEKCETFEDEIDLKLVDRMDLSGGHFGFATANAELLKEHRGTSDPLYMALLARIDRERARMEGRSLVNT